MFLLISPYSPYALRICWIGFVGMRNSSKDGLTTEEMRKLIERFVCLIFFSVFKTFISFFHNLPRRYNFLHILKCQEYFSPYTMKKKNPSTVPECPTHSQIGWRILHPLPFFHCNVRVHISPSHTIRVSNYKTTKTVKTWKEATEDK